MKFIEHFRGLFANKTEYAKGMYALFKLEAKLAGLNIVPLLVGIVLLLVLGITIWLTLMFLLGYLLIILTKQPATAIIIVLLVNSGLAFYIIRDIKRRLLQMSFARTRDCLRTPEKDEYESEEKAIEINQ